MARYVMTGRPVDVEAPELGPYSIGDEFDTKDWGDDRVRELVGRGAIAPATSQAAAKQPAKAKSGSSSGPADSA